MGFFSFLTSNSNVNTFEYPDTDPTGHKLTKIHNFDLAGSNHIQDGNDPQDQLRKIKKKEQLQLQADKNNKYDSTAIKVLYDGCCIGWIPDKNLELNEIQLKQAIHKRLLKNQTVYARLEYSYKTSLASLYDIEDPNEEQSRIFRSAVVSVAIYEL